MRQSGRQPSLPDTCRREREQNKNMGAPVAWGEGEQGRAGERGGWGESRSRLRMGGSRGEGVTCQTASQDKLYGQALSGMSLLLTAMGRCALWEQCCYNLAWYPTPALITDLHGNWFATAVACSVAPGSPPSAIALANMFALSLYLRFSKSTFDYTQKIHASPQLTCSSEYSIVYYIIV